MIEVCADVRQTQRTNAHFFVFHGYNNFQENVFYTYLKIDFESNFYHFINIKKPFFFKANQAISDSVFYSIKLTIRYDQESI